MIKKISMFSSLDPFDMYNCKHFFYKKLIYKKLYWESQMAKKYSVLKPWRLRNL